MQFPAWSKYFILINALATLPRRHCVKAGVESKEFVVTQTKVDDDFQRILEQQLRREREHSTVELQPRSRKRRYLQFPEGSSFQLVWDGIIGVVDYTNYLILGVTVAVAWQLPHQLPNELLEELNERIKDGTLGIGRNDTVNNLTYVDTRTKQIKHSSRPNYINLSQLAQSHAGGAARPANSYYYKKGGLRPAFQVPMHKHYYYRRPDSYYKRPVMKARKGYKPTPPAGGRRKDYYYYSRKHHPFEKWTRRPYYGAYTSQVNDAKYPWWNLASRISDSLRSKIASTADRKVDSGRSQQQRQRNPIGQVQQQQSQWAHRQSTLERQHRIYPVFGKRSLPDSNNSKQNSNDSHQWHRHQQKQQHYRQRRSGIVGTEPDRLDRINIRHHRSTRQDLYEKIEKYLDKKGLNGHHCVLRALCETGQKATEREPGSFVGELMRALFTLPEPLEEDLQTQRVLYKEQRYDSAHALNTDCAERYQLCKDSLWESHFVG